MRSAGVSTFSSTATPAAFKTESLAPRVRVSVLQVSDKSGAHISRSESVWSVEPFFEYSPEIARCITGRLQQAKFSAFEQSYFTTEPPFSMGDALAWAPVTVPLASTLLVLSALFCRHRRKDYPRGVA
jgi:hypothetical protein